MTLGADKGYDAADFVEELCTLNAHPQVAQKTSGRRSAIDRRTTRHAGNEISQRVRKHIEEGFGWIKTVTGMRRTRLRGLPKVDRAFTFAAAAYNLVKLLAEPLSPSWASGSAGSQNCHLGGGESRSARARRHPAPRAARRR